MVLWGGLFGFHERSVSLFDKDREILSASLRLSEQRLSEDT